MLRRIPTPKIGLEKFPVHRPSLFRTILWTENPRKIKGEERCRLVVNPLLHFFGSAKTDPVRFKWGFGKGLLKDKFAFFEAHTKPIPRRRKLLAKRQFKKKGPLKNPFNWTGSVFPLLSFTQCVTKCSFLLKLSALRAGVAIRAACCRTEKPRIPQKCRGECWEECREKEECWGDCWEQCCFSVFFQRKWPPSTAHSGCPQHSPFSRHSSQHSPRHFWGIRGFSAAAFWGFSRGGFPENACIRGAISERNFSEICRRKSPQNTEKHKTKLCAEVPERPLPKDPFFSAAERNFLSPVAGGPDCKAGALN